MVKIIKGYTANVPFFR